MFIPIRTSVRPRTTPYANYGLIIANALIFLITYYPHDVQIGGRVFHETHHQWVEQFMLHPTMPNVWQFVTYAFLHGGWMHIIGNMYFLYLFGNAVNDKLGNVGYICFYLAGAVFSGLGHALISPSPVLGASGAVAAVTGAFLVLYPKAVISVVYWFFIIGTWDFYAYFFIAIKLIIIDNVLYTGANNVAYEAHLSGYAFGILAILGLLASKLLKGGYADLWSMLKQWTKIPRYKQGKSVR